MKMKIYNGTPHDIIIVVGATYNPALRKYTGGEIVLSLPINGVLNARIPTVELEPIGEIPIFSKKIEGFDPLPVGYDVVIVSALYASAVEGEPGSECVYTVADPVMSNDGNTFIGCRGICKPMQSPALSRANEKLGEAYNNLSQAQSDAQHYSELSDMRYH
jgi:hypothetical protein